MLVASIPLASETMLSEMTTTLALQRSSNLPRAKCYQNVLYAKSALGNHHSQNKTQSSLTPEVCEDINNI